MSLTAVEERELLAARDGGWKCHYCERPICKSWEEERTRNLTYAVDGMHIQPGILLGQIEHKFNKLVKGRDRLINKVLSCKHCNQRKKARPYEEAFRELRSWSIRNRATLEPIWADTEPAPMRPIREVPPELRRALGLDEDK